MDKKTLDEKIDSYFEKNDIKPIAMTDKEKLLLIKDIIYKTKIDSDLLELSHSKRIEEFSKRENYTSNDLTEIDKVRNNFVDIMESFEINILEGSSYIGALKGRIHNKKISKIKKAFKLR